jgi:hypothetical protein
LEEQGVRIVSARDGAAIRGEFDIVHLNFPNHYVTEFPLARALLHFAVIIAGIGVLKLMGKSIVYTVHDVEPLNSRNQGLARLYARLIVGLTDGFVFLNDSSRSHFLRLHGSAASKPVIRIEHGAYPTTRLSDDERARFRRNYPEDRFLVGYIGAIKSYKNPGVLTLIPTRAGNRRMVHLVVAGKAEATPAFSLDDILQQVKCPFTKIAHKPDDAEIDRLFQTVDIALFPYARGSNSGAAMLCLSNGCRLIASDLPMFKELEESLGPPWVYTFRQAGCDSTSSLAAVLQRASMIAPDDGDRTQLLDFLERNSFEESAGKITDLYRCLLGR